MADDIPRLAHYLGLAIFKARGVANLEGDLSELSALRTELLTQLRQLESGPATSRCLEYIEKNEWKTPQDVEDANAVYEKANPNEARHQAFVEELFRKPRR